LESRNQGRAKFDCSICELSELAKQPLADFAAVCLVNPTPLEPDVWKKLGVYAEEGHGVAVFLGKNALPVDSFNSAQAQALLPGKLLRQVRRPDGELRLAPRDFQHPILAEFRKLAGSIPWESFPVFRYWELELDPKGVQVVVPYSDGKPAIVERPIGHGRAITMTTPVSDDANRDPWNLLPTGGLGDGPWPFMILANRMAAYLVGSNDQQLNYPAGQMAVLRLDAAARRRGFMLYAPGESAFPLQADLNRSDLPITETDRVGNYRLQSGGSKGVNLGFSVNYARDQTRIERLSDQEVTGLFGPVKFQLARTREQIDRNISMGRVGRELFPSLILIVALVLGLELLVSNRFYRE
jgi:hypothetical protein